MPQVCGDSNLTIDARLKSALWNESAQTDRLGQLEATLATLAPLSSVAAMVDAVDLTKQTADRLAALEAEAEVREAATREALTASQALQDAELARQTDERLSQVCHPKPAHPDRRASAPVGLGLGFRLGSVRGSAKGRVSSPP